MPEPGGLLFAPCLTMSHRILLVDDEDVILSAMREYITLSGYQVDCAGSTAQAEALLATTHYAVVIADLNLNETDGYEGLQILDCARAHCQWTRSVLFTAYGGPEIERQAREHGIDVFLYKPQPLAVVTRIISQLVIKNHEQKRRGEYACFQV